MLKPSIYTTMLCAAFAVQPALARVDDLAARPAIPAQTGHRDQVAECGASAAARFIGASAASEVRAAIASSVGHARIRWISPGSTVTQDYRPDRLNVIVGSSGRVMTMRCG
ncbi:MAG: I78 family peptidase inhibitor [Pseudomonadota bacterium]